MENKTSIYGPKMYHKLAHKVWDEVMDAWNEESATGLVAFRTAVADIFSRQHVERPLSELYRDFLRCCVEWFGYTDTREILETIDNLFINNGPLTKSELSVVWNQEDKRFWHTKMFWYALCETLQDIFDVEGYDKTSWQLLGIGRRLLEDTPVDLTLSDAELMEMVENAREHYIEHGRLSYELKDII